jgi:hypothetical protein
MNAAKSKASLALMRERARASASVASTTPRENRSSESSDEWRQSRA